MESKDIKADETLALLRLIAESRQAGREGRWLTQEQMEKELRERFGI